MSAPGADGVLRDVLGLAIRDRHDPDHQFVFVSSPPGGGKTALVEDVAAVANHYGLRVAAACPRASQATDLALRMKRAYPGQPVRLWLGQDRAIPPELREPAKARAGRGPEGGSADPVDVGTAHKLARLASAGGHSWDLLVCDESYQLAFADFAPLLGCADRFLLVGDPGQLPPVVRVDAEAFAAASFRPHAAAAAELARLRPEAPRVRLRLTRRLPPDTATLLQPLYPDLSFAAACAPDERRLEAAPAGRASDRLGSAVDRAIDLLAAGASLVAVELPPKPGGGNPLDPELSAAMARVAERMLARRLAPAGGRPFSARDLGLVDPHVASGQFLRRVAGGGLVVDTPERWQGLERALTVVRHPIRGQEPVTGFAADPGRVCVSLSRHRFGCVIVARAGIEDALDAHAHDCGRRATGADDRTWDGVAFHLRLWRGLREAGLIVRA